jgi:hypothetical protein
MKDISDEITDKKWKKFFDIDPELYRKSSFLRSIKRNYLRQGMLTAKQKEMFLKVVKEGAQGFPKKRKKETKPDENTNSEAQTEETAGKCD